jgi:hypothetical protein
MTVTPFQRTPFALDFARQCVGCLKLSNNLWDAQGVSLTDDTATREDGFCNSCWNY